MSRVIAVVNQKGGVGKTTTTISLGSDLARTGRAVLIVDTDPQANATSGLGARDVAEAGVYDVLVRSQPIAAVRVSLARFLPPDSAGRLDLVAASPDLAGAEVELVAMMAREFRLKNALEPVRGEYDFVLIDCPPSLGLLTINALSAADEVLIPVQTEYLALEGLGHLAETIELIRRNLNPSLRIGGLLLTMFDARTRLSQEVADEVRKHFPNTFTTVVPRSIRLSEAPSRGLPIGLYDPTSRGAAAYQEFAREFAARAEAAAGTAER